MRKSEALSRISELENTLNRKQDFIVDLQRERDRLRLLLDSAHVELHKLKATKKTYIISSKGGGLLQIAGYDIKTKFVTTNSDIRYMEVIISDENGNSIFVATDVIYYKADKIY